MCSIGALIAEPKFPLHLRRKLVLSLLPVMIARGDDATGIAAFKSPREVWIAKEPVPSTEFAQKLSEVEGWEEAPIILLHARAYTSCYPSNNYCNHPIYEVIGDRVVALVHNGVVYDKRELAEKKLDVDTDALLNPVRRRGRLDREAVEEIAEIDASMAIVISDGEKVYGYRNTNPMCLGIVAYDKDEYGFPWALVVASTCDMVETAASTVRSDGADLIGLYRVKPRRIVDFEDILRRRTVLDYVNM